MPIKFSINVRCKHTTTTANVRFNAHYGFVCIGFQKTRYLTSIDTFDFDCYFAWFLIKFNAKYTDEVRREVWEKKRDSFENIHAAWTFTTESFSLHVYRYFLAYRVSWLSSCIFSIHSQKGKKSKLLHNIILCDVYRISFVQFWICMDCFVREILTVTN